LNNVDIEEGWWYSLPIPGKKTFKVLHKPENVTVEEVNITCTNYARLCGLMDSIFSTLHAKRGSITDEK